MVKTRFERSRKAICSALVGGVLALLAAGAGPASAQFGANSPLFQEQGVAKAIEGDILVVNDRVIALYGIDAPARGQTCVVDGAVSACGFAARDALEALLQSGPVSCMQIRDPSFRRRVLDYARCTIDGVDLAAEQIRQGMAMAFTEQSARYVLLQAEAKAAGIGLWAADIFEPPWQWEENQRMQ